MKNCLKLPDAGPLKGMKLQLARRLTVLTGDNGLGKSFVLNSVWQAVTGTWPGGGSAPRPEGGRALSAGTGMAVYAMADDGFAVRDAASGSLNPETGREAVPPASVLSPAEVWHGQKGEDGVRLRRGFCGTGRTGRRSGERPLRT